MVGTGSKMVVAVTPTALVVLKSLPHYSRDFKGHESPSNQQQPAIVSPTPASKWSFNSASGSMFNKVKEHTDYSGHFGTTSHQTPNRLVENKAAALEHRAGHPCRCGGNLALALPRRRV